MVKKYLKWNCRRGILENDLYLKNILKKKKNKLKKIYNILYLIKLNDNYLLNIILKNKKFFK